MLIKIPMKVVCTKVYCIWEYNIKLLKIQQLKSAVERVPTIGKTLEEFYISENNVFQELMVYLAHQDQLFQSIFRNANNKFLTL